MKMRKGFVSNSSSSSFIINIVKVTDEAKFLETAKRYNVSENRYDLTIIRGVSDYVENYQQKYGSIFDDGDWAGNYIDERDILKIWEEDYTAIIAVYSEYGGDDSDFAVLDENGDYEYLDYDKVALAWFDGFSQHLYDNTDEKEGFENIHSFYGAGRNG